jgi:5-methyltetrahydrofolate--homocysteine methyltransferase
LLIGGATTSRAHTAIKIAPNYQQPVVYVPDASRAVGVVSKLLSETQAEAFKAEVAADYEKLRAQHAAKKGVALIPLTEARANRAAFRYAPIPPRQTGITQLRDIDLAQLAEYIDWGPFFQTWDLAGSYPGILDDAQVGAEVAAQARSVFADAQAMLKKIIAEKWLTAHAVFGLFPANAVNDDIVVYADETRTTHRALFHCLRQQQQRPAGKPNQSLADFIAPPGMPDWLGAFACTAGIGIEAKLADFATQHDDYRSIMLKSLADRLAEACAEWLHHQVRVDTWGYAPTEALALQDMIDEKYLGIRPAAGYPACPDHTEKGTLFALLDAENNAGMVLTESYAMQPAAAVSGLYFAHPESRYFAISKIGRDQLEDWAQRKGMDIATAERWLAPIL